MKNNFLQEAYGGLREARSKHYCLGLPRKWKVITSTLLLLFTFAIGNVWADTFTASEIAAKSGDVNVGTTKNHVTVSSLGITSTTNTQIWKDGSTAKSEAAIVLSAEPTSSSDTYNKANSFVEIRAERGYALGSTISVRGGSTQSSAKTAVIVYWNGQASPTFSSYDATSLSLGKKDQTSNPSDINLTVPSGARTARIYRKVKVTDATNLIAGNASSSKGGGYAAIVHVIATAVLSPEIEGDSQMLNDETISLVGYPAGGTWGVKAGDPGTITADGKLTATGNGTIHVTYTVDEVEETKEIVAAATKTLVWNFDTKDVLPTTAGIQVTTTRNSGFNNDGSLKLTTKGSSGECDFAYIDLTSKNWEIVSVVANVKAGGTGDGKNISFGSAASDVMDGNIAATSTSAADYNITPIKSSTIFSIARSSGTGITLYKLTLTVKKYVAPATHTLAWDFAGGSCSATEGDDYTAGGAVAEGATLTYPAANTMSKTDYLFDGWSSSTTTMPTTDLTITAQWATAYTVTFASNGGGGTMDPIQYKADAEVTIPACDFTPEDAYHAFTHWAITGVPGKTTGNPGETFDMPAGPVTLTAQWAASYGITKGSHTNGDFTIDPTSAAAGTEITLAATPDEDYLFGAWEVVKTSDGTDAGVTVTNNKFEMPAFAVTVNATFVADTRKKILYLTSATTEGDKLYEALKDDYNVTVAAPEAQTLTNYDLVVLHESIGGNTAESGNDSKKKQVILDIPTTTIPVLNTKSYFYTSARWNWGGAANGKKTKGMHVNTAYCNIASHPLFDGLTPDANDSIIILSSINGDNKPMQPVTSFTSGKEGYTLANVPDGCAIHELTPTQRGVASGKYLLISIYNKDLANLNANGQKLFQNAAAYLIDGSASWTPVAVPTSPVVAATPTENYTEGGTITLTASAEGTSASTVYTWYKGADWATASATTPVQAASTSGATFSKTAAVEDAGTYWCNISNGTSCDAQASVTITVSSASTPTHTISYDNVKGADMTAYPTEYTEGIGVASFDPLADITGWHFVEWSPASIATDATTDQTITAVWAQVFEVTFNLQGHGAEIAKQDIISGEKATEPTAPRAIGYDFGGWFTDAECTAGNEFDFETPITAATPLFAKWTAFEGCTELWPATSGDALIVGAMVDLQAGSVGGSIKVANLGAEGSIAYNANGLSFSNGGKDSVLVTLNNDLKNGSIIKVRLMANGGTKDSGRGLNLYNAARVKKALLGWQANEEVTSGDIREFTYTVVESDGFAGTNVFTLQRQNSVFLQSIKVEECGDAIVYHNLTSEVSIAGKGIVTLGASSVREGYTTTATYSDIDPLYEFEEWQISGEGATLSGAEGDHVTVTMGTADAVVTLKLRLIPVKFTVNYYDGETPMGTEQVAVNENPTASEITTAKRHYTFLGWSTTNGGDVVALNTITRTETGTVNLYAKYEAVACPTSGTIFSMESDEAKKPTSTVTIAKDASIDLAEYATISGGNAMIINGESSGKDAISTDGEFLLKATKEVMKIELNCVLQEGDIIRIPDNSAKLVISTSNAKTGTYQAFADKNTHEFAVTAAWAGVDDIYVLYDGSSLKFTKVYVIRPAKYTVTFDMKDHGSAIADITNVIEGSKISAPTAPTDAAYSFAGWYKENTLENEWDFDVDVVTDNITLYAKWLDKSDATLKSLKYGSTEIELQAGIYTYAVELPSLTTSVPALTAETSNPNASTVITDDDAFDGEGHASSTVEVTPEKEGAAHQTYTVNFTKLPSMPLLDVDNSIVWNFGNAGTQNNAFTDEVLANFPGVTNNATFRAQTLKATGAKIKEGYLQGTPILFHATKAGLLRVEFANTGGGTRPYRYLVVNGERTAYKSNNTTHVTTAWIEVPAGDVTIEGECVEDANGACTSDNLNFYKIEFLALAYTRDDDWMAPGELGTICYPEGLVAVGADMYEMDGVDANHKFVFYEVNVLEPGKPYLFEAQANVLKFYATTATAADAAGTSNGMIGTFASIDLSHTDARAAKWYYFSGTKFYAVSKRTSDLNVPANRAYVDLNESHPAGAPKQGVRRLTFNVDGMNAATGMDELNASETPVKMLIDGQLFILRGEKMYNANGQLVK